MQISVLHHGVPSDSASRYAFFIRRIHSAGVIDYLKIRKVLVSTTLFYLSYYRF